MPLPIVKVKDLNANSLQIVLNTKLKLRANIQSAIVIQKYWRRYLPQKSYKKMLQIRNDKARIIQKSIKRWLAKFQTERDKIEMHQKAIIIQKFCRGYLSNQKMAFDIGINRIEHTFKGFDQLKNRFEQNAAYLILYQLRKFRKKMVKQRKMKKKKKKGKKQIIKPRPENIQTAKLPQKSGPPEEKIESQNQPITHDLDTSPSKSDSQSKQNSIMVQSDQNGSGYPFNVNVLIRKKTKITLESVNEQQEIKSDSINGKSKVSLSASDKDDQDEPLKPEDLESLDKPQEEEIQVKHYFDETF